MIPASGAQYVLAHADQVAVVTEVGATLRSYISGGRDVCWGFGESEMCGGGRGQVLAPWPNRLRDGRYTFEGVEGHAALDEPDRANAIHGIVRWVPWRLVERTGSAVRLAHVLHPQPAYPFRLHLELDYGLDDRGLTVVVRAVADGDCRTPFGVGFHPYFAVGPAGVDEARLAVPADVRLLLDERALPVGSQPVAGTPYEVAAGSSPATAVDRPPVGSLRLDDCFTGLALGRDRRWRAELLAGGADEPVVVWADASFAYAMVYSGDTQPGADRRRAIAVEPMTCPPDALRTGDDLIVLEPGESFAASWGVVPPGADRSVPTPSPSV
ncbi:MAG TPA: aldose 1-epimerase family protein [Acidimicrobiales bacterium]|nr:aldose 1-epimerase family protein [Acidimicrobiales bacterium]